MMRMKVQIHSIHGARADVQMKYLRVCISQSGDDALTGGPQVGEIIRLRILHVDTTNKQTHIRREEVDI